MSSPIVRISDGKVKGTSLTDSNGENFHAFLSIPFGKTPVGNLRFKAPQPVEPWFGIKDATKQGDCCIFENFFKGNILEGSEDCLNLHVFTKKLPSEEKRVKPVLLYIHGGGFVAGSHDRDFLGGPEHLMTEDVVLVFTTYRQGILGYLSLEDTSFDVPGNAGLKDLVFALKWVQKNIQDFNGDPNNVTIFGQSAGGAAVEYLVLSPSTKNLFHKAIAMSGSTLNPWTRNRFDPVDFCKHLGYPDLTEKEVLKVLTEIPAVDLYRAQIKYQRENYFNLFGLITPVVEKPNPTAFITKRPIDIMLSGEQNHVPYIIGYCDQEGLMYDFLNKMRELTGQQAFKEDPTMKYLLPNDVADEETIKKMVDKIKEFYNEEQSKDAVDMLSDSQFIMGCLISALTLSKTSKHEVYSYRFVFNGELNFSKKVLNFGYKGASHGDDMNYLLKPTQPNLEIGEAEKLTTKRLVTLWTNFAKYGNPTPKDNDLEIEWKPVQNGNLHFLHIEDELMPSEDPYPDRLKLWKEVFQMDPNTAKYL